MLKMKLLIQLLCNIIIKGENNDNNNIVFILNNIKNNIYYINAYSIIIEKNYDIEYLSYSGLIIKDKRFL